MKTTDSKHISSHEVNIHSRTMSTKLRHKSQLKVIIIHSW